MRYFRKTTALAVSVALIVAAGKMMSVQVKEIELTQKPIHAAQTRAAAITTIPVISRGAAEPTATPSAEPTVRIYDIPLEDRLQEYTFSLCEENGLDYELVLAVMEKESHYNEAAISKTDDYGLMQINEANHEWLEDKLGISDFLDAKQNIRAGIYILSWLTGKYEDPNKVLMAYNNGENGAKKLWQEGITSSKYSRAVIARADELREEAGR
jgi:soluble lytic murein transglycosylase-like protein